MLTVFAIFPEVGKCVIDLSGWKSVLHISIEYFFIHPSLCAVFRLKPFVIYLKRFLYQPLYFRHLQYLRRHEGGGLEMNAKNILIQNLLIYLQAVSK